MLISVVIPTYNEEENIPGTYQRLSGVLNALPYEWEMIFVNDGSRDRSAEVIADIHERDPRVCLLSLSRNFGAYGAISAGFVHARGAAIVCISCDLQDPPELIAEFVRQWEAGHDIVWGTRAGRKDPPLKSLFASTFYFLLRRLVWKDFPEGGIDYGLFDRRVIDLYNRMTPRNNLPFLTIYDMGFRQAQIPYQRVERQRGHSNWTFFRRIKAVIDVLLDFSYMPIRLVSTLGYIMSGLSLLYGIIIIFNRLILGQGGEGWPSIVASVVFIGGVQLVVLGILGEYIWRIADGVRDRPRFIIMDRRGFSPDETPGKDQEIYRPHSHEKPAADRTVEPQQDNLRLN